MEYFFHESYYMILHMITQLFSTALLVMVIFLNLLAEYVSCKKNNRQFYQLAEEKTEIFQEEKGCETFRLLKRKKKCELC